MELFFISIFVVVGIVFAVAFRMDRKRRHLGDTKPGGAMRKASRQTRLDGKEKSDRWGAGA